MAFLQINNCIQESIVDGPGLRFVIFTQGCPHRCPGCHNPQTHQRTGGTFVETEMLFSQIMENPLLQGVTFSGGEPFLQPAPLADLAQKLHSNGLDVVTYTGYTLEKLKAMKDKGIDALLRETDLLIDGPFQFEKRDLTLPFRGSRNQRVIELRH
ncbi:anaerobic ribonucleoside-triphosphate reductase activating protein [Eubacterium sp. 1001713B170207_170306_E7]|uniref:anaerobic ribonucleoside-triphosphate reductase activating protein n=1 Tax=Eubacterium sp. 1001713B170207_170306_E7 TaxID=2787097 RepID=UPI00189B9DFB|nr:anaerobic ribonucleoside-triphosphate reductase activating protein [Eubacterium sp. 1001713B170207_170306_E7]